MDPINNADALKALKIEEARKRAIKAGGVLASPEFGDEIVISGNRTVFLFLKS